MGRRSWWGVAFVAFAALLVGMVMVPTPAHASGNTTATYIERGWDGSTVTKTTKSAYCTVWDDDMNKLGSGWYYFNDKEDMSARMEISGDVHFILGDNCNMELCNGIKVGSGSTLSIYCQSGGTGKLWTSRSKIDTAAIGGNGKDYTGTINIHGGVIEVRGGSHNTDGGAGIGGGNEAKSNGAITIYGGTITAQGGPNAAGIGGGDRTDGGAENGTVTIYGGTVNATGGSVSSNGGAGIGGGGKGHISEVNIYGGTVKAKGGANAAGIGGGAKAESGTINISGGTVTATGDSNAAGIGGGQDGAGKNINISGGSIEATGGSTNTYGGAGIGGGGGADGDGITISGGTIKKANGGANAAGIGGGDEAEGKNITISGGTVNAKGGSEKDAGGAGIGSGHKTRGDGKNSGSVTVSGGNVTTTGGANGAGIGGGENKGGGRINITGGTVKATGGEYAAGIGSGEDGVDAGTITISGSSAKIKANGGKYAAGIGGGYYGGRAGSITITGCLDLDAYGGLQAAGIGSGKWSSAHSGDYYGNAVSVTIRGGYLGAYGGAGGAGIGAGTYGPSGRITIEGGRVFAFGGPNGGAGIGSGEGCHESDVETINITIKGGEVKAQAGRMDENNNWNDDPGAAIGTGGCIRDEGDVGLKVTAESYFIGNIRLEGGTVRAYSADITSASGTKEDTLNVIGTTSADDNRDWFKKGRVIFNGATVYMYPGAGSDAIKQVVKAGADASEGGIVLRDDNAQYQRVTFTMDSDSVGTEREAKQDYRIAVLSGDEAEEYGTNDKLNHSYKLVKVAPAHKHVFTYSTGNTDANGNTTEGLAEGNTIIATCKGGNDCELKNQGYKAKLIISAPDHNEYGDGLSADAKIEDANRIGNASVVYYKANSTDGKRDGDPLDPELVTVPPKDPGTYRAEITLDGEDVGDATAGENKATAHVVYTISRVTPKVITSVTVDEKSGEAVSVDLSKNVENAPEAGVTYTLVDKNYSLAEKGIKVEGSFLTIPATAKWAELPDEISVTVGTSEYSYDTDHYDRFTETINVAVNKLPRPVITAEDVTFVYSETDPNKKKITPTVKYPSGDPITGATITYAVKNTAADDPLSDGGSGTGDASGTGNTSENDVISVNKNTGQLTAKKTGEAVVTVTVAGNDTTDPKYASATKDVNVTVKGAAFPGEITADGYNDVYDGQRHGIKVSLPDGVPADTKVYYATKELTEDNYQVEGFTVDDGEYYSESVTFKDAGTYTVYYYVTAPNYEPVAGSAKVEISQRPVAVTVSASDKTYDGTTDATVTATIAGDNHKGAIEGNAKSGLVGEESIEISGINGQFADKNAGENKTVFVDYSAVTFFGDNPENYTAKGPTETVTATISKAWAVVMADDVYLPVSDPLPEEYTAYAYGAIEGEEIVYSVACSSAQAGVKGEYEITVIVNQDEEPNNNYDVWCVNGTLTITQSLAVTASGYTGVYDGEPHSITVDVKTPELSSLLDDLTEAELLALIEYAGIDIPEDAWDGEGWTDEQWAKWAEESGLSKALEDFKWAEVYYSTEELTKDNYAQVGSTTNPSFTDAGTYNVSYAVVGFDGEVFTGSKAVVIDKAAPNVTAPAPVAGLHQNGGVQALVTPGSVDGGTMEYSLDGQTWSKDVPTASDAGTYVVSYRVTGDVNHKDVAVKTVVSSIATEEEHASASTMRMYRLYNPNSGEHFYTASEEERDYLSVIGWRYEGTGWIAPVEGAPVYRLYNPNAGDHHYTMSVAERDFLVSVGWNDEGVGWNSAGEDGVPLWRQYNPNAVAGAHNYTTNAGERDMLISVGWSHEGVGWYGL